MLDQKIKQALSDAFKNLFNHSLDVADVALQPTRKEFEGTYTFVTFPFGKVSKLNPEETGKELGEFLKEVFVEFL